MTTDYLGWDSAFFNKKVGKIILQEVDRNLLVAGLKKARYEGYQLLYLYLPQKVFINDEILMQFNGKLVDRKAEFQFNLKKGRLNSNLVDEYKSADLTDDLENLSYLCGRYSRFYTDRGFEQGDYYRLYYTWISKSISKELADRVFVIQENGKSVGMVTLKHENNIGKIGLIAVAESVQGKGYGRQLIEACKNSLAESGIQKLQVSTQLNNRSACQLYIKCGFRKTSVTNIDHFCL